MVRCCIPGCKSDQSDSVKLYKFPADDQRRQLWIVGCRRMRPDFAPGACHRLCEKHFDDAQYESHRADGLRKLRPDAVPMVFDEPAVANSESGPVRSDSSATRKRHGAVEHQEHVYCKQLVPDNSGSNQQQSIESVLDDIYDSDVSAEEAVKVKQLQLEIRRLKWQLKQSTQREAALRANLATFLNSDQIEKLTRQADDKGRDIQWTNETVQRSLAIRSVIGRNGYDYLRHLNYPLPSYRTLCRRIQNTPFAPGIQHDVLRWLKLKMDSKPEHEKLCSLLVDEMQLKSCIEYDTGLHRMAGYVSPETLPADASSSDEKTLAVHALVFMLRGLTSSWKQTVAYLYTGTSIKKEQYWDFTKHVIEAAESAGFRIQCVISDMGPSNTALWNHVGVQSTRAAVTPSITNPAAPDRSLFFVADPPHLLKNLWNCVLKHRITLNKNTVSKYHLPGNIVNYAYVHQLIHLQQGHELRVAHKLKDCHVNPTQYEKMRVGLAAQFFSRSTASALELCVRLELLPRDALTMAWFLSFVNDWFDAMNARHKDAALYRGEGNAKVEVLHEMLCVIQDLEFSGRRLWKPVQAGIQLSTTVVLQLSQQVMTNHNLLYFLTGRLTQDSVENLFSQARGQGVQHPSCTKFRQALRLVTIAQYLQVNKSAAYDDDGCAYLVDYLKEAGTEVRLLDNEECLLPALIEASADLVPEHFTSTDDVPILVADENEEPMIGEVIEEVSTILFEEFVALKPSAQSHPLGSLESNALYDVVGWSVAKFLENENCKICRNALVTSVVPAETGTYTEVRSHGGLTHPSQEILQASEMAESVFCSQKHLFHRMSDIEHNMTEQVMAVLETLDFGIPDCHRALYHVMRRFIRLRVNEYASTATTMQVPKKQYGSKTACRTTIIF